jgi:XTP/dITP diphosphohydrolase
MRNPKEIYFVTTNAGKAHTAGKVLSHYGYSVVQKHNSIEEPEHTNNPKAIAEAKIAAASGKYKNAVMCEDGGFFVEALGGEPGVKVHGYLDEHGLDGLLKQLKGEKNRKVYFWSVLAYAEPGQKPIYLETKTHGVLAEEPRGHLKPYSWSQLHLAFIPDSYDKTLSEMTEEEYNRFTTRQTSLFIMLGEFLKKRDATKGGQTN